MIDRTETAPLKEFPQLKNLTDRIQSHGVTAVGNHTFVLVLDLTAAVGDLFKHHPEAMKDIERFKAGDYQRLFVVLGDKTVRGIADYHADMAGTEEPIQLKIRRVQNRLNRRNDRDVITKQIGRASCRERVYHPV